MQFLVVGKDGDDEGALSRRMAARQAHIELGDQLLASGNMWYGAAILKPDGSMGGSALFMNFETKDDLNAWLKIEPYVTGDVWRSIEIHKCNTRDPWQFNRPKEFFENLQKNIEPS